VKLLALTIAALAWVAACQAARSSDGAGRVRQPDAAPSASAHGTTASVQGCDAEKVERSLAQQLFDDSEFRDYICEGQACTLEDFGEELTIKQVVLRDEPRTNGCIVGPLHPALTRIYGVFMLSQSAPSLELVYLGIDISVDPAFKGPGFKDLIGSERRAPGTWVDHRYVWGDHGYALESTTEAVDTPAP
jgi:hypothetical protein